MPSLVKITRLYKPSPAALAGAITLAVLCMFGAASCSELGSLMTKSGVRVELRSGGDGGRTPDATNKAEGTLSYECDCFHSNLKQKGASGIVELVAGDEMAKFENKDNSYVVELAGWLRAQNHNQLETTIVKHRCAEQGAVLKDCAAK